MLPSDDRLRCARCGDVIGAYEPVIVVDEGRPRVTSLASEPEAGRYEAFHHACAAAAPMPADEPGRA